MVSTPEELADDSPLSHGKSKPSKKSGTRKSLRQFSDVLDIKNCCS